MNGVLEPRYRVMTDTNPKSLPSRVLVAEDEHLIAAGICSQLTTLGCTVIGPAADGQDALHQAELHAPSFAVLDIRMPVLDGLEAAKTLWNDMGIPSMMITAFADARYIERAQETGVFGYLLKPPTADALRVTLSVAWAQAQRTLEQGKRIRQLENLLANRKTIEQAKWRLIETRAMTEPQAHAFLQQEARNHRRKLIDVACSILGLPAAPNGNGTSGVDQDK